MSAHSGEERLGPYCLREQLGEGGMGVVYLAHDSGGRPVAVKVLRQGIPAEATARRRLAREVDTMRRVHSPYVAEVIDADVEGSQPYIVTRYVAGRTLDEVVAAEGPLTGPALASLARGLAAALVAVHTAGVVHRDLKPGNVMLVGHDPVVIDFGIAHAADSTRLTLTGMFMGTPGYLAPEVIEGRPSGPAADVHSWGATMAYAATGKPPFGTGQFEAIFYRIVHGQPELDTMPAALLALVLPALARDPSRRPSAADLAGLTAALDPAQLVRRPVTRPALTAGGAGPVIATAADLQVRPAAAAMAAAQAVRPAGAPGSPAVAPSAPRPGTLPISVPAADDFADLLTPVRYDQGNGLAPSAAHPAGLAGAGYAAGALAGAPVPGSVGGVAGRRGPAPPAPVWPGAPPPPWAVPPGGPVAGRPGAGQARAGAVPGRAGPARTVLVLATLAGLVALSILLPVAGTAIALATLILLRAADLTGRRLARRRAAQGPRRSDPVSMTAFYPVAVVRSVLSFLLLAPLALLCAVAAATLAVLAAGPSQLTRAGGYAVGALVACYCIGPGSKACRRPLSAFYGGLIRSAPAAVLGSFGLVALAAAALAAAATLTPGYWPAGHLGNQLQTASLAHPVLNQLPGQLTGVGRRIIQWLSLRV
jgi:predicted Ser/Thr protein kinase